jgi:hypothetical protein
MKRQIAKMTRPWLFLVFILISSQLTMADDELHANVAISVQQDGAIWMGQQVTLNLDLKTTGFSFANTHFNLPEVSGAFLMQTDTTTIKFSEKVDGITWQVIRYPLALYPQKAGQLDIPAIDVRFNTSAGFGSEEEAFTFQTEPLQIPIQIPTGMKQGDLVITTSSFEFDYNWQPESGAAQTGDALTLTVSRRASDISAMLLPPLPIFQTKGLAAYPQAPEVEDKTNRGDLTGERIDSIIWVVEAPGTYNIPAIRFQWWDPVSLELKQQIIPGLDLDILPSATDRVSPDTNTKPDQPTENYFWFWFIALLASITGFLWLHRKRSTIHQHVETEKSAFEALQLACKSNHGSQTYTALHAWLLWVSPAVTLSEFARLYGDTQLTAELQHLQQELVSPDSSWQGNQLLIALRRNRNDIKQRKTFQSKTQLAPLNPKTL